MKILLFNENVRISISFLIAFVFYISYFFLLPFINVLFANFLFPSIVNADIGGIVLLLIASYILQFIFAIISLIITWIILRKFLFASINLGFFLIISMFFNFYSNIKLVNQIKTLKEQDSQNITRIYNARNEAQRTQITILNFKEMPGLDSEGYLKYLNLELTVESNRNVVIDNPLFLSFPVYNEVTKQYNCYSINDISNNKKKTYTLKKGISMINSTIVPKVSGINRNYVNISKGPFIIEFAFGISAENTNVVIENITNKSTLTTASKCYPSSSINNYVFETQEFKVRF